MYSVRLILYTADSLLKDAVMSIVIYIMSIC